ncbi:hypothetical protein NDU88_000919 [Pleurodeles waltl]|uniref:Uncharacterized protein n=1 Tax=Pleurodeles waltl TaxID=8319 RepID=A0AAV7M1K7_PLEWA|nr:hypothetical protein NDU88_000919 [Pleurodeles waltl]
MDAARPTSATSTPEGEDPSTNPRRLPGYEEQRQGLRALSSVKGRTAQKTGRKAAGGAEEHRQDVPRSLPIQGLLRPRPG